MDHSPSAGSLFLNRELSWLDFNERVLDESRLTSHPLLERVKFLAIASSNLDEFVMIRVSGLQQKVEAGQGGELSDDGMSAAEQLARVRSRCTAMLTSISEIWRRDLRAALASEGIVVYDYADLDPDQLLSVRDYFEANVFPVLTPLAIDPGHPFPHISNLSMNLAIVVEDPDLGRQFARVKIPGNLPRLAPCAPPCGSGEKALGFVWLEQIVAANLDALFRGLSIVESHPFRLTRNADIEIQEDEASDLLRTVEEGLRQRHFGSVARLELGAATPDALRDLLIKNLPVGVADVVALQGSVGLADLMELTRVERSDLKDPPLVAAVPPELQSAVDENRPGEAFAAIAAGDILLHHPYDSFRPVVAFLEGAARDPAVQAIKLTLYRVGNRSPVVSALQQARDDDTQVAVLVELKARFDEENNIEWARALEESGVHVAYGLLGLKTHCKMALIVRHEQDGLRRYLHLGTGNYNPTTARVYTDFSLFTAREDLAADASDLFNVLTGYSRQKHYRRLLVAPVNMRAKLLALIAHEAECARAGVSARLLFKVNALVDPQIIQALYDASCAGVKVDLIVRGICCLRPGAHGQSENIRVISIVGRFLEHSRAFYFENGGALSDEASGKPDSVLYLGSADLMQRNLDRRVEVLFPIDDPELKRWVRDEILEIGLADTQKGWELMPDGRWRRVGHARSTTVLSSQQVFMDRGRVSAEPPAVALTELKSAPLEPSGAATV